MHRTLLRQAGGGGGGRAGGAGAALNAAGRAPDGPADGARGARREPRPAPSPRYSRADARRVSARVRGGMGCSSSSWHPLSCVYTCACSLVSTPVPALLCLHLRLHTRARPTHTHALAQHTHTQLSTHEDQRHPNPSYHANRSFYSLHSLHRRHPNPSYHAHTSPGTGKCGSWRGSGRKTKRCVPAWRPCPACSLCVR